MTNLRLLISFALITSCLQAPSLQAMLLTDQSTEQAQQCLICSEELSPDAFYTMTCCKTEACRDCLQTAGKRQLASTKPTVNCPFCRAEFSATTAEELKLAITSADILRDMGTELINHLTAERLEHTQEVIDFLLYLQPQFEAHTGHELSTLMHSLQEFLSGLSLNKLRTEEVVSPENLYLLTSYLHALVIKYEITEARFTETLELLDSTERGKGFLFICKDFVSKCGQLIKLFNDTKEHVSPELLESLDEINTLELTRVLSHFSSYFAMIVLYPNILDNTKIISDYELISIELVIDIFAAAQLSNNTYHSFLRKLADSLYSKKSAVRVVDHFYLLVHKFGWQKLPEMLRRHRLKSYIRLESPNVLDDWEPFEPIEQHLYQNWHHPQGRFPAYKPDSSRLPDETLNKIKKDISIGGCVILLIAAAVVILPPYFKYRKGSLVFRAGKQLFKELELATENGSTEGLINKINTRLRPIGFRSSWSNPHSYTYDSDGNNIFFARLWLYILRKGFTQGNLEKLFEEHNTPDKLRKEITTWYNEILSLIDQATKIV